MTKDIISRKERHIDAVLSGNVNYFKTTGLERYDFLHNSLPEIDLDSVDTKTSFLGKSISFPLIISSMTGGTERSKKINMALANAAEKTGVALALGSQRIAVETGDKSSFDVRKFSPTIPLFSNLGAIQLNNGYSVKECRQAVESIGADALMLHLNPMQEAIQGGNTNFRGLLDKIKDVCRNLGYPVIIKEVGFGISSDVGMKLDAIGVYAIDVSGSGGTSWSAVESRISDSPMDVIGKTFWNWGIPTAESIVMNSSIKARLIAGGGIRNGLDMAKCIALGADYVTVAGPLLKAAETSSEEVISLIELWKKEFRIAMFGIGASSMNELKGTRALVLRGK